MNGRECPRQREFVTRIGDGSIDESLRAHLDVCDECREAALVMAELAPLAATPREVPPFADLYWRIQAQEILETSSRRRYRVVQPLRVFQKAIGIGMIAMAMLLATGPLIVPLPVGLAWMAPLAALGSAAIGGLMLVSGARSGEWLSELVER